jgi:uncharacterized membrane protein YraQ (UPF0718 family)
MTWQILWALIFGFLLSAIIRAVVRRETIVKRLGDESLWFHSFWDSMSQGFWDT